MYLIMMPATHITRITFVLLIGFICSFSPSILMADQGDSKLNTLFEKLSNAVNVKEARAVEYEIIRIWGQSGDKEIDQRMSWGGTAMREGSFQEALEIFTAITKKKPNFSEGWNMHATILFFMDRHEESLESVQRTLELEPRHFGALAGKGLMFAHQERLVEALEIFETAKNIYPLHSRINERIAQMHLLIKVKKGLKEKSI